MLTTWKGIIATASVLAASGITAASAAAAPTASVPPSVSGKPILGGQLACKNGSWSTGAGSFTFAWQLASGNVPIASGATVKPRVAWVGQAIVCVVTAKDSSGTGTAVSPPVTIAPAAAKIVISKARQTAAHTIEISGHVTPTASLAGGTGSLILYRQTRSGLQQLSFNGNQTRPSRKNGAFTLIASSEPTGRFTYVVQYVPSAPGYAPQVLTTRKIRVHPSS
jgi:hypothetical protein